MIHFHPTKLIFAFTAALFGELSLADEELEPTASLPLDFSVEEILVVGSRLNSVDTTTSVFEIDRAQLERQAPLSILDALQNLPGIYVSQPGGRSGIASVTSRGAESNFTVVMVDGVQVNDPTNTRGGSFDFTTLDLNEVQSIQLIQGPASSRYGSDALAGVINITTIPRKSGTSLQLSIGEQDFRAVGLRSTLLANELGRLNLAVSTVTDEARSDAEYSGDFIRLNYSNQFARSKVQGQFSFAESAQSAFPEDSGGREFAIFRSLDERSNDSATFALSSQHEISANTQLLFRINHLRRRDEFNSPGIAPGRRSVFGVPPNSADSRFERTQANLHLVHKWPGLEIVAGIDWRREDGEADGEVTFIGPTFFALNRNSIGLFAEALVPLGSKTKFHASLRRDEPEQFDGETTYALALDHTLNDRISIFARTASGFKLPSFFALGNSLVGNPDLNPETVTSYEVGVSSRFVESSRVQLSWFYSEFEELIDFDPIAFTNINRSNVTTTGFDLNWSGELERYAIQYGLFVSYVDIEVEPSGRLRQRPRWSVGANVGVALGGRASMNLTLQNVDERFDSSIPNPEVELAAYTRLDAALHYDFTSRLRSSLVFDNLFDESFSDADGFPAIGRRGRVTLRYTFN